MEPTQPESTQPPRLPLEPQNPVPSIGVPGVRWVLVRAALLSLLIVIFLVGVVWLVGISLFSGTNIPVGIGSTPQTTIFPSPTVTNPTASITITPTASTDVLPRNLELYFYFGLKDTAGHLTVIFDGGPGKAMVKEINVRLTRPDNTVDTRIMPIQNEFPEVTLQGSKNTDRLEVFVTFLSGKTYKIVDEQVPYRQSI